MELACIGIDPFTIMLRSMRCGKTRLFFKRVR